MFFFTAIWLRCRDPNPGRWRACALYCLSRSILKVVVAALSLAIFVYSPFTGSYGMGGRPVDAVVQLALFAVIGAHVILAVAGWRSAQRYEVRIWIDSGLNRSRRKHIWPPRCQGTDNEAADVWLAVTTCIVSLLAGFGAWVFSNAGLTAVGILAVGLVGMHQLARKIVASTPEECWYVSTGKPRSSEDIRHA